MAGTLISDYAVDTPNWTELLSSMEKQRKGKMALSLTNYNNSNLPAIEAGSYLEIAGALYGFVVEEAISGAAITGNINYIMIDPITITAEWTLVAPIWSPSKNGWYDAGEAKRYIGGCYRNGANYSDKWVYHEARSIKGLTGGLADLVLGRSGVHIGSNTRSTDGDQVIIGVGFKPSIVIFHAADDVASNQNWSVGFDDGNVAKCVQNRYNNTETVRLEFNSIGITRTSVNWILGLITTLGADGFTVLWSTQGTSIVNFTYLCIP